MPNHFKVVPTPERPFRALPIDLSRGNARGEYQCVISLPAKPTKVAYYRALHDASLSLAELAEKWLSDEGGMVPSEELADQPYRISLDLRLTPETKRGGVRHTETTTGRLDML